MVGSQDDFYKTLTDWHNRQEVKIDWLTEDKNFQGRFDKHAIVEVVADRPTNLIFKYWAPKDHICDYSP